MKSRAELSPNQHLVVSWIRWPRRKADRLNRPKCTMKGSWESGRTLCQRNLQLPPQAAVKPNSEGHRLQEGHVLNLHCQRGWWTLEVRDAVKDSRPGWLQGLLRQLTVNGRPRMLQPRRSWRQKLVCEEFAKPWRRTSVSLKEVLANHSVPRESKAVLCRPHL